MVTDGSDVLISLELPGVDVDKDVDIEVAQGRLTISGQRPDRMAGRDDKDRAKVLVRELRYGSFRREFALPDGVTADDVDAAYEHGMLHVRVRHVTKPVDAPKKVTIRGTGAEPQHQTIEGQTDKSEG
jgi:HSP20 family protein